MNDRHFTRHERLVIAQLLAEAAMRVPLYFAGSTTADELRDLARNVTDAHELIAYDDATPEFDFGPDRRYELAPGRRRTA